MTARNDITIEAVQAICAKRRGLLVHLVHSQVAKVPTILARVIINYI
jgi:hypothetical protein